MRIQLRVALCLSLIALPGCGTGKFPCDDTGLYEEREEARMRGVDFVGDDEISVHIAISGRIKNGTRSPAIVLHSTQQFFIYSPHSDVNRIRAIQGELPGVSMDTLDDFRLKSDKEGLIGDDLCRLTNCCLISNARMAELLDKGWDRFHDRFPGSAVLRFSRVGFNADRSQAVVFVALMRGGTSGISYVALLEKSDEEQWEQVDEYVLARS